MLSSGVVSEFRWGPSNGKLQRVYWGIGVLLVNLIIGGIFFCVDGFRCLFVISFRWAARNLN